MNKKIINFEEQLLKNKLKAYEEDLKTYYPIVKRKEGQKTGSVSEFELKMDQYELFHMHTYEFILDLSIFPEMGLANVEFADSDVTCALAYDSNTPAAKLEKIYVDDVEKMIQYFQFTETDLYADDLEGLPRLSQIKESPFHKFFLHSLIAIQYFLSSVAKLHV